MTYNCVHPCESNPPSRTPGTPLQHTDHESGSLSAPSSNQDLPAPGYIPPREFDDAPPLTLGEHAFRHSGWAHHRRLTAAALHSINPDSKSYYRFFHCGCNAWVQTRASDGKPRVVCNTCRHRMCVPCRRRQAACVQTAIAAYARTKTVRFVTLTLRHNRASLSAQVDRLYRCITVLRKRKDFTQIFKGGVIVCEVKKSERDGCWHVHAHLLVEGQYVQQRDLSAAWYEITGDSSIVDIRAVDGIDKATAYLTKYVTKPADSTVYEDAASLREYIVQMHGRRLVTTFGAWRGLKLSETPPDTESWQPLCSLNALIARATAGEERAVQLLEILSGQHAEHVASALDKLLDRADPSS